MRTEDATLPGDLDTAHRQIRELAETLPRQDHLIAGLQHQLERLLRQRYGKKGEAVDPARLLLFMPQIPVEPMAPLPPPAGPTTPEPKPQGHGRKPLPAALPGKRVVHDVPLEGRACPGCGGERSPIGEDAREPLEYVPGSLIVLEHARLEYACQCCSAHLAIAGRLPEPIEKGPPGPGSLAHVALSKYADHLPLSRREGIFKRFGVELSRSTMCDGMAAAAGLLEPIVAAMTRRILLSKVIGTDDTPVKVQDHTPGKGIKTGRLRVYLGDSDNPFAVHDYRPDRGGAGPERFLKGSKSGYLQSDAYSGYDAIHARGIVEVGCRAHARRKFYHARTSDPERSHAAIARIGRLYGVESDARKHQLDAAGRHALRQGRSRPILESFGNWPGGEAAKVLPKSPIGGAISYSRTNWTAPSRYLEAECLSIDKNASENAIRPIAVGRKNRLFCGSDRGGQTGATLMSPTSSCKSPGVEPFAYLRDVLDRVSTHPNSRIAELLPDRWREPETTDPPDRKGEIMATPRRGLGGAVKQGV